MRVGLLPERSRTASYSKPGEKVWCSPVCLEAAGIDLKSSSYSASSRAGALKHTKIAC